MNGDGIKDMITGHYWPGDIFVFYGKKDGTFKAMENLKDETGRNLNPGPVWKDEQEPEMQSLAAAPYATDWDGDGDFDMLIGNIVGQIVLMENIGTKKAPKFSTKRQLLNAGGEEIKVGGGDSGPVFEDWDGDGVRDLLSGAGDGSVTFYRNVGQDTAPKFAAGEFLVAPGPGKGMKQIPVNEEPTRPGGRTKLCVVDYDQDGHKDLLVGDFCSKAKPAPKLNKEQIELRDDLRKQRDDMQKKIEAIFAKLDGKAPGEEQQKELEEVSEKFGDIYDALRNLEAGSDPHGFVWLYLRKANVARF